MSDESGEVLKTMKIVAEKLGNQSLNEIRNQVKSRGNVDFEKCVALAKAIEMTLTASKYADDEIISVGVSMVMLMLAKKLVE